MRYVVPAFLMVVAAIHALPIVGVLGAGKLSSMYGVAVNDPNLEILLRHRAVLFGLLSALLIYCALDARLHRLGLVAALVSVLSFLVLAQLVGMYNASLSTVVRADIFALVLIVAGGVVHLLRPPAV